MADSITMEGLNSILEDLKNTIASNLSDTKLRKLYIDQVDSFIRFYRNKGSRTTIWEDCVGRFYEAVTGAPPYKYPGSLYLRKKARNPAEKCLGVACPDIIEESKQGG